jgi:hypothetical protein
MTGASTAGKRLTAGKGLLATPRRSVQDLRDPAVVAADAARLVLSESSGVRLGAVLSECSWLSGG